MITVAKMIATLQALPQDAEVWIYQENDEAAAAACEPELTPTGEVLIAWDGINYNEGGL